MHQDFLPPPLVNHSNILTKCAQGKENVLGHYAASMVAPSSNNRSNYFTTDILPNVSFVVNNLISFNSSSVEGDSPNNFAISDSIWTRFDDKKNMSLYESDIAGTKYNRIAFQILSPWKVRNRGITTLILHAEYLRTYEDAGAVNVYFCGKFITMFDALWKEQVGLQGAYSLVTATAVTFNVSKEECDVHTATFGPSNGSNKYLVLELIRSTDRPSLRKSSQKFKLIGVTLCVEELI